MVMLINGYDVNYKKEDIGLGRIPTFQEVMDDYMSQEFRILKPDPT